MKKIICIALIVISMPLMAQSTFVIDGIEYKVLTEADEVNTFGTVSVVSLADVLYEGILKIPNGVKNSKDKYADSYKVIAIADKAFKDCVHLKKVYLPASLESIGVNAFENCTDLSTIELAVGNLKTIGREAFKNSGIEQIIIPEGITEIPWIAFYGCKNLKVISLPSTLKIIGCSAFAECKSLRTISLPSGVKDLMPNCFGGSGIEYMELPAKIVNITDGCFSRCESLKDVKLSPNIHTIESGAFLGCTSLENIEFPKNLEIIGTFAFSGCSSLRKVIFQQNSKIKEIDKHTFDNCGSLKEIVGLPNGMEIKINIY